MTFSRPMGALRCSFFLILIFSQSLFAFNLTLKESLNWAPNDEEHFPLYPYSNESEYYLKHYEPYSHVLFNPNFFDENEINLVSNLTANFWYSLPNKGGFFDNSNQTFYSKTNKFTPVVLQGDAEFFRKYSLQTSESLMIQDLKISFTEEIKFDENPSIRSDSERIVASQDLNTSTCVNVSTQVNTELNLYYFLGRDGEFGSIFADTLVMKAGESQRICTSSYVQLNLGDHVMVLTTESTWNHLGTKIVVTDDAKNVQFKIPQTEGESRIEKNEWYYYNPKFNFTLRPLYNVSQEKVLICDVAANCHYYLYSDNLYILTQNVTSMLDNTPFVRFVFDKNLDNSLTFAENLQSVLLNRLQQQGQDFNQTMFLPSFGTATLTVRMEDFDFRFMKFSFEIFCDLKFKVSSVNTDDGRIDFSFLPPKHGSDGFVFESSEFYFVEPSDVKTFGNLNITLMNLHSSNSKCYFKTFLFFQSNQADQQLYSDYIDHQFNEKKDETAFFWRSGWIRIGDENSLRNFRFNSSLKFITDSHFNLSQVEVRRWIIGENEMGITRLDNDNVDFNGNVITVTESSIDFDATKFGSAFKIYYSVIFPENTIITSSGKINFQGREYRNRGAINSLAGQDNRYKSSVCLSTFTLSENVCSMEKSYRSQQLECEPESCNNLLAQPVLRSTVYADKYSERYYPLRNSLNQTENLLLISNDFNDKKSLQDVCFIFSYCAQEAPLKLTFDGTGRFLDFKGWSNKQKRICASHYITHPSHVKNFAFEFLFPNRIRNLEEHWVQFHSDVVYTYND